MNKTFALLYSEDFPMKYVLFIDYYENLKEDIESKYEEISVNLEDIPHSSYLKDNSFKVFKQKQINYEQDNIGAGTEG
jgi:hypothetical protein